MDRSGMILFATGSELNEYIVSSLIANSPAEESGLLVGDKLLKIQGLPARFYSMDQINRLMQKREGKRIKLTIERGAYTYKVTFKLRSLIWLQPLDFFCPYIDTNRKKLIFALHF